MWALSQRRYANSEKGRTARKRYQESEKGKAARARYLAKRKTKLLELKKEETVTNKPEDVQRLTKEKALKKQ